MKNTELFDLLGKIDDRFYDEALGGDSERPVEIMIKKQPFSLKRIALPAAACLAAAVGIGVTAHYLNKTDFTKVPTPTTSTVSEPNVTLVNPEITAADLEQCKEIAVKYFPATNNDDFDFERNIRVMDVDFDGSDEVVITPRPQMIVICEKTSGGMIDVAQLNHNAYLDPQDLSKYDQNGDQYYYFRCFHQDLNSVRADSVARIKYNNNGEYTLDYPLAYGYYFNTEPRQWFFMTGCTSTSEFTDSPSSNISSAEFKAKWQSHSDLPAFDYYAAFDEEYPLLSEVEIPVVENAFMSADNMLHGATLDVKDLGEYKLCLLANTVFRLAGSKPDGSFYAGSLQLGLVKDNELVSTDGVSFFSATHDGFANYNLNSERLDNYVKLYNLADTDIAIFGSNNSDKFGWESNFFGINDGKIIRLYGDTGASGDNDYFGGGISTFVNAPLNLAASGNSLIDVENGIEYAFAPNAFNGNPFETPHFTTKQFTSDDEFPPYNGEAAFKATLSEKKVDKYTISLLGYGLKTTDKGIEYSRLEIAISEGSKRVFFTLPFVSGSLETQRLDEYLLPFEMKDGVGFGAFVPRGGEWEFKYLQLYEINTDLSLSNITYRHDYAPVLAGSPAAICGDITVVPAENKLVGVSEEYGTTTIEINFAEDWYTTQY